jgi:hypothetical protein
MTTTTTTTTTTTNTQAERNSRNSLPDSFFTPHGVGGEDDGASNPLLGAASLVSSYLPA